MKLKTAAKLTTAAREDDTETVRTLLLLLTQAGAQSLINYQDASGTTPLFFAARHGHASVTKQLIHARCNVDLQKKNGASPLFIAAEHGHASVTEQLIEARCNVDLPMEDGCTPLFIAAEHEHVLGFIHS